MNRHNSNRRPTHSYSNCRHKSSMQKCPKQTNKKHCFAPNKKQHTQMQSIFNLASMETLHTFTINITPPKECTIGNCLKSNGCKSSCSCILMKNQNQRYLHPHNAQSSLCRPRTRIHQVISVVGPTHTHTHSHSMTRGTLRKIFIQ